MKSAPGFETESSWQFDLATGLNTEHVSAELDLFSNRIHNFIFSRKLNGFASQDSIRDGVPAFKFVSGDAHLYGGEAHIDIHPHPLDWLHFENSFSYVRGVQLNQPDSMKNLPLIPASRFQSTLRADIFPKGKTLRNGYIEFGLEHDFTKTNSTRHLERKLGRRLIRYCTPASEQISTGTTKNGSPFGFRPTTWPTWPTKAT